MKSTSYKLQRVQFMPKVLERDILYVAEEFDVAGHLCACGCGNKVMTPLGSTEWTFHDSVDGPTLSPSIGSWQLSCQSHYWITRGKVRWSAEWTPAQIERGRRAEDARRHAYFESREPPERPHRGVFSALGKWMRRIIARIAR